MNNYNMTTNFDTKKVHNDYIEYNVPKQKSKYTLPKSIYITASQELKDFNIIREFSGLRDMLRKDNIPDKNYKQARYNILLYIINNVKHDHINGDYYDEDNNQLVIDAGHLLYKYDGMQGMYDNLVWDFIPKRYRNDINYLWNGIGEWIA